MWLLGIGVNILSGSMPHLGTVTAGHTSKLSGRIKCYFRLPLTVEVSSRNQKFNGSSSICAIADLPISRGQPNGMIGYPGHKSRWVWECVVSSVLGVS